MYLKEGLGYHSVARELNVHHSRVYLWVKRFKEEGMKGLEEKRGKAKGPGKGRPKISAESLEEKIKRLEAENEFLKKLLEKQRGDWTLSLQGPYRGLF